MVAVTPLPIALGMLASIGPFAALTWYLVRDSRRPVNWSALDARAISRATPHVSHARVAMVSIVFTVWSLWATARPVSRWS